LLEPPTRELVTEEDTGIEGGLIDGLALLYKGKLLALVGADLPLFEEVTSARTPSEYLNIFNAGDLRNGDLAGADLPL
jgi:hypothetical protein